MKLIRATSAGHLAQAGRLFEAYAASLDFDLGFQDFEREMATFPGDYAPPGGLILLLEDDGDSVGCIALRRLERDVCEMKRLFVDARCRGRGAGRILVQGLLDEARRLGYARMRLDTAR